MARSEYVELLRDPRWQRKRLEVMERDGFRCRTCGDGTSTLNVHHLFYVKNAKPWDYEANQLITLCESCHLKATEHIERLKCSLSRLDPSRVWRVIGYVDGTGLRADSDLYVDESAIGTNEYMRGVANAFQMTAKDWFYPQEHQDLGTDE